MTGLDKFNKVMTEYNEGRLRSYGKIIKDKRQALAIAFSEARKFDKSFGKKHEQGTKVDSLINVIFDEAWIKWKESNLPNNYDFDTWLILTPIGQKYYKRIAEAVISEPYSTEVIYNGKGGKLKGKSHKQGGIPGVIKESGTPIEVEGGELIINKRVGKIKKHISCKGTPEGVASRINELTGGVKFSNDPGKCTIKTKKMKKGSKLKEHVHGKHHHAKEMIEKDKQMMEHGAKVKGDVDIEGKKYKVDVDVNYHENGTKIEVEQYIKVNEPKELKIMEIIGGDHFDDIKVFCYDDIYIYESKPNLIEFLDMYNIHYTVFESSGEFIGWLKGLLPKRIQDKI